MITYRAVKAEILKLEKHAADLLKNELEVVVAKAKALISEYGLTAANLGLTGKAAKASKGTRQKSAAAKAPGVAKYVDSASGKTWTGKGKPPTWMSDALKSGKSKEDFLIGKRVAAPVVKAPKAAKKAVKKVVAKTPAKKARAKAAAVEAATQA